MYNECDSLISRDKITLDGLRNIQNYCLHLDCYCEYNNKDEDNSLNILSDKNYQTSSQKFRQENVNIINQNYWQWGLGFTYLWPILINNT